MEMSSSSFKLISHTQYDDVIYQVKRSGTIQRVAAIQDGWELRGRVSWLCSNMWVFDGSWVRLSILMYSWW